MADLRRKWSTLPRNVSGSLARAHEFSTADPSSIGGGVDAGEALAQGEDLVTA